MALFDLPRARDATEKLARGRIVDLRVERVGEDERWVFRLDGRPHEFVFEPSPLSPRRRTGDAVAVAYAASTSDDEPRRVAWITSA